MLLVLGLCAIGYSVHSWFGLSAAVFYGGLATCYMAKLLEELRLRKIESKKS